jgi:hypothetical protein
VTEGRRLIALAAALTGVLGWISWGTFGGHEFTCDYAVTRNTTGKVQYGYITVPCNASFEEQREYLDDHGGEFHPVPTKPERPS